MRSKIILVYLLFAGILFHSCMPYQYIPSNQYVPLNKKKGELKASVGLSTGPFIQSYSYEGKMLSRIYEVVNDIQLGYSFSDHFSIFTSGHYRDKSTRSKFIASENDKTIWGISRMQEVGIGGSYFAFKNNRSFELLNGIGIGKTFYDYSDNFVENHYTFNMQANRFTYYIQPDYGFRINKFFEMGLFSRFTYFRYYNISTNFSNKEYKDIPYHNYYDGRETANLYFIEPGILIRGGSGILKYQFLFSKTLNLNVDRVIPENFTFRFSLLFDLDLYKDK